MKGGHPVIVLSDTFWQRRFNRSPAVIGQVAVVNATPMTIIGVARPGFFGVLANEHPAFFVPTTMKPQLTPTRDDFDDRQSRWLHIVGRLAPGVSREQAKAAADVRYQQINAYELEAVPQFAASSERVQGPLPRQDPDAARRLAWAVADPRRSVGAGRGADGHGRAGAAHRLRQRRQPDAGAGHRPAARDERAPGHRRQPGAPGAPDAGRERAGRRGRRRFGLLRRGVARRPAGRRAAARRVRRGRWLDHRPTRGC